MNLKVFSGPANLPLAGIVAAKLGVRLGDCLVDRFPDGELHVEIRESVRGHDVYLIQPTSPPAEGRLLELLLLADACRRAGAGRLTAVIPYFGYARQDRRVRGREAIGARVMADLISTSGFARLLAVDLHSSNLEGLFPVPLEHLSAVSLLAGAVGPLVPENAVVVAPDLGAVKLAERYAGLFDRPVAIIHKIRISGEAVRVRRIVGDVAGRVPFVVDDMISTGGTIEAAVQSLLAAGCVPEMTVVASHALLVAQALDRLGALRVGRFIVSDSVALPREVPLPLQVVSLGPLLADAIRRLHDNRSLGDLISHA